MAKLKNEKGNKYGKLTVIERAENIGTTAAWLCRCDCGNEVIVRGSHLRNGNSTSCGCSRITTNREKNMKEEKGNQYGKLLVISEAPNKRGRTAWLCECECGNKITVVGKDLRSGNTKSCGCVKSWAEKHIENIFIENNINYKSQYYFEDLIGTERYLRFDFGVLDEEGKLLHLIEYDGRQHFNKEDKWYKESIKENDIKKNKYCEENNIELRRFSHGYSNITIEDLI